MIPELYKLFHSFTVIPVNVEIKAASKFEVCTKAAHISAPIFKPCKAEKKENADKI